MKSETALIVVIAWAVLGCASHPPPRPEPTYEKPTLPPWDPPVPVAPSNDPLSWEDGDGDGEWAGDAPPPRETETETPHSPPEADSAVPEATDEPPGDEATQECVPGSACRPGPSPGGPSPTEAGEAP